MSCHRKTYPERTAYSSSPCDLEYRSQKHAKIGVWLFIACSFFSQFGFAQNTLIRQWSSGDLEAVYLDFPMVGEIYISNSSDNKINLSYLVEGEYQNSYYLKDELSDQNLFIGQQANPFLTPLSDKLSVHKVFASKVKLSLPAYLKVALIAASSKLSIEGSFKSINIQLLEGEIELNCGQCPGIINTKKADIEVNQVVHSVHAVSHKGKVLGEFSNTPKAALKLNSISGNISIRSQKNNYF